MRIVLATVCALLLTASGVAAQVQVVVAADNATWFTEPSFNAKEIGPLPRGSMLTVLQKSGAWIRVYDGHMQGFVPSAFVITVQKTPVNTSAPSSSAAGAAATPRPRAQVPPLSRAPATAPPPAEAPASSSAPADAPIARGPTRRRLVAGMPGYKDPTTATLIGLVITGGGQFYAGETGKGFLLLGGSLAAVLAGSALSGVKCSSGSSGLFTGGCHVDETPLDIGVGIALGAYVYGIIDAPVAARRYDARGLTVGIAPYIGSRGEFGVALRLRP